MKGIIPATLLLFSTLLLKAQTEENEILTFSASKPTTFITVTPEDSTFWTGEANRIKITATGKYPRIRPVLLGGKIVGKDSIYHVYVDSTVSATLAVYSLRGKNSRKLVYTKPYEIKTIPPPTFRICGVSPDSTIDKKQLIEQNAITATSEHYKAAFEVLSFDMIFVGTNDFDTLHSNYSGFTPAMRNRIHQLAPGSLVYFDKIEYWGPKKRKEVHPEPLQIFVDETNKYRHGYAKTAGQR